MMNMNYNTNLEVKNDYVFRLQNKIEKPADDFQVEFFVDEVAEGRWQGIYKIASKECELAAASITSEIEDLAGELIDKIILQMPNRYEFAFTQQLEILNS